MGKTQCTCVLSLCCIFESKRKRQPCYQRANKEHILKKSRRKPKMLYKTRDQIENSQHSVENASKNGYLVFGQVNELHIDYCPLLLLHYGIFFYPIATHRLLPPLLFSFVGPQSSSSWVQLIAPTNTNSMGFLGMLGDTWKGLELNFAPSLQLFEIRFFSSDPTPLHYHISCFATQ